MAGFTRRGSGVILLFSVLLILVCTLSACGSASTPPILKIGLIAPFEGPSRSLGYSVLHAARLRIHEWNEAGNKPQVELVALNDNGDAELSAKLAAQLAADPDIIIVLAPPQSHTSLTASRALGTYDLPTLSLSPLPESIASSVFPYGGLDTDLQRALAPFVRNTTIARDLPLSEPSIWLGDPLSLAHLMQSSPHLVSAAGPVGAEISFSAWAGSAAEGLIWAGAMPAELPLGFGQSYQAVAGESPRPIANLAYAATDEALRLLQANLSRSSVLLALDTVKAPSIQVYRRQQSTCCEPLSNYER